MRTKPLLLVAAVAAASAVSASAQVFSVNAVGYVNKIVPKNGFALIANPLDAGTTNNTIAKLFAGVPDGTKVYKYIPGTGYKIAQFDDLSGEFSPPDVAALTVVPGEGVFVQNPLSTDMTITFVGEVMQGSLSTPLVAGLQIV